MFVSSTLDFASFDSHGCCCCCCCPRRRCCSSALVVGAEKLGVSDFARLVTELTTVTKTHC